MKRAFRLSVPETLAKAAHLKRRHSSSTTCG